MVMIYHHTQTYNYGHLQVKHVLELEKVLPIGMVKRLTENKITFNDKDKKTSVHRRPLLSLFWCKF